MLSLAEDVGVVGGLGVLDYSYTRDPWLALAVFGFILLALLYLTPKIFRFLRIKLWLFWQKLASPPAKDADAAPLRSLPAEPDMLLHRLTNPTETVAWAAPCLTGRSRKGLPANFDGWLVGTVEAPEQLYFVGRRGWKSLARTLPLDGCKVSHEPRFLSEDLVIYHPGKGVKQTFVFPRPRALLVENLAALLRERLSGFGGGSPARATVRTEERLLASV